MDRVRADLFEAAPILGIDLIKVGADDGVRGRVRGAVYFTRNVKTTRDAVAFVTEVGNPNGVLLLDI